MPPRKTRKSDEKGSKSSNKRKFAHKSRKKSSNTPLSLDDPSATREATTYENPVASRELILRVVNHEGSIDEPTLCKLLNITQPEQLEGINRRLRAMVRDGQLVRNRAGIFIPVNEEDLIRGRVIAKPDGFGFLVPEEGGDDLFLNARQMRTVLHGDKAVAQVTGIDRRGRREGAIIKVVERANTHVVGRLNFESGIAFLSPDNKRIHQDILIPPEHLGDAKEGQMIVVEIIEQPTFRHQPIGKLDKVLCDHMAPGMEIDVAIHAHGIPFTWPAEVEEEISGLSEELTPRDKRGREDIREYPLVTIDGEDSRDFDDAVYCEPTTTGWKLWVAIADVSHYVKKNSPLDVEAHNRGTSVYFPGRVVPMLPEILSNGLCSINPDVERLCMVCEMRINKEGKITRSRFFEGLMRSQARLTYNKVHEMIHDKKSALRKEYKHVIDNVDELNRLYKVLAKTRKRRGAIEFDTQDTQIVFGDNQRIESIQPTERNDAHKLIEECMISANVTAAKFLKKYKIPTLFRDHDGPKEDKVEDVRDFLSDFGFTLGARGKKPNAIDYNRLLQKIKGRDDYHLIQTVLLRSLSQAVYSPDNIGHFGLSLENYAHFTSPIRRYPDLLVHRGIRAVIRSKNKENVRAPYGHKTMQDLGDHCSTCERRADDASREAEAALKCEYMMDKVGEVYDGIISAVTSFGVFVELKDVYIEGLIHITNLPKDYYVFDPVTHRLNGEHNGYVFQLGDHITIEVANVNLDERKIDFSFIKLNKQGKKKPAAKKSDEKKSGTRKAGSQKKSRNRSKSKSSTNSRSTTKKRSSANKKTKRGNLATAKRKRSRKP